MLGVPAEASSDDIRPRVPKARPEYHPDINDESGAEERFRDVGKAYEVLSDSEKRKRYDRLGDEVRAGAGAPDMAECEDPLEDAGFGEGAVSDFFERLFGEGAEVRDGGRLRGRAARQCSSSRSRQRWRLGAVPSPSTGGQLRR